MNCKSETKRNAKMEKRRNILFKIIFTLLIFTNITNICQAAVTYNNGTWTTNPIKITLNQGSDALSGHKTTVYSLAGASPVVTNATETMTITEDGITTIGVSTTDNAGNTATNNYSINILRKIATAKANNLTMEQNTTLSDDYGNTIWIPQGFKIASDSAAEITEGVVIEDVSAGDSISKGNQFVWVPVGTGIKKSATETVDITLGRYDFTDSSYPSKKQTLKQDASNYTASVPIWVSVTGGSQASNCSELATSTYGNATAKNLKDFVNSVALNKGYYIGRYEAGKVSGDTTKCVSQYNKVVYDGITQPAASTIARNMYNNTNIISDLTNSYAFDTAIVFIEKCGTETCHAFYADLDGGVVITATGKSTAAGTVDMYCNIYDLATNVAEWSTETSCASSSPYIMRGYDPVSQAYHTQYRSVRSEGVGFRPILYLN